MIVSICVPVIIAAARAFGVPVATVQQALESFRGLEHRLELVRERDGVRWVNDSKATNPGATLPALALAALGLRATVKLKTWVRRYFRDEIAPIITPIGLDPTHPFPLLVNKSLNFIVELEGIDAFGRDSGLAIIPAPRLLPRVIKLPEDVGGAGDNYVFLSSMIHAHADDLFHPIHVE